MEWLLLLSLLVVPVLLMVFVAWKADDAVVAFLAGWFFGRGR